MAGLGAGQLIRLVVQMITDLIVLISTRLTDKLGSHSITQVKIVLMVIMIMEGKILGNRRCGNLGIGGMAMRRRAGHKAQHEQKPADDPNNFPHDQAD
jgi:hypothetical protein